MSQYEEQTVSPRSHSSSSRNSGSDNTFDQDSVEMVQDGLRELREIVRSRLAKNLPIRRDLPGEGRVRIDRQLPFLCVARPRPAGDNGTRDLVTSEAAYLHAPANEQTNAEVAELCRDIARVLREHFGMFLFIEIWSEDDEDRFPNPDPLVPAFRVITAEADSYRSTTDTLAEQLRHVRIDGHAAEVEIKVGSHVRPTSVPSIMHEDEQVLPEACMTIGLCVKPIYRNPQTGDLYPMVLQKLRRQLSRVIRKTVAEFTGADSASQFRHSHYQALGPNTLSKIAGLVDQELCELSQSFDFLIQSTPENAEQAWEDFSESRFRREPQLFYPQLPFHISLMKRQLFAIEIEQVEDPSLAHLFYEKQAELDLELSALAHLEKPEFLHSTVQLYGQVDEELLELAEEILRRYPQPTEESVGPRVGVEAVMQAAREELDHYHRQLPEFNATVEICEQLTSGLMVSHHRLLLGKTLQLAERRVDPLLHHEVGTHLLTYFNGRCQPLRQLYAGLAGYEELQEGLAVLAEYLTGGLSIDRLRTLASRVIAAHELLEQSSFIEAFTRLHDSHKFPAREAFSTTLRIYRGGGNTKDVIYLRGLRDLLNYLAEGHEIEPLYVGKIGLEHVPYVQELRRRGIVKAPALLPRFWAMDGLKELLEETRHRSLLELMERQQ
ncbi:flavohemoglobin expression-modulating QEGLA motif protein [Rubinisphaera margarita]|uniref:flavohemoglobin expression-modulating QEGLA motif protein n=1 Tax=Rubinisphaera margarita TaxID=2909586 RepID=UPI001EE79F3F|nr:tyrosine/phenylalanine carboxypeptidase domain-containing protein [Rubinisphaera margarita]MCG6154819.1 DUF1704 domain-containing protein [Rubinisphaera margarita]